MKLVKLFFYRDILARTRDSLRIVSDNGLEQYMMEISPFKS